MEYERGTGGNNLLSVLMREDNLTLQQASDYAGQMCRELIAKFQACKAVLPSFANLAEYAGDRFSGPMQGVDDIVETYVQSLEHWITGNIYWSFHTQRYFGPEHKEVEQSLVVNIKGIQNQ